jgi:hypothetical protein
MIRFAMSDVVKLPVRNQTILGGNPFRRIVWIVPVAQQTQDRQEYPV